MKSDWRGIISPWEASWASMARSMARRLHSKVSRATWEAALDIRFRDEQTELGSFTAEQKALQALQSIYDEVARICSLRPRMLWRRSFTAPTSSRRRLAWLSRTVSVRLAEHLRRGGQGGEGRRGGRGHH